MKDPIKRIQFFIVAIGAVLFVSFLGSVHLFDWDEINFAEAAREMIVSKNYLTMQINFQPFWEKPPLFIWMQALSMKVWGINEFAARFPNAVCGIVTLLMLYHWGRKFLDGNFGVLWVMMYCCSVLPFFYFKSGIIDPWFNLFILLGVNYAFEYSAGTSEKERFQWIVYSAFFTGLAILTKGPVALLILGLTAGIYLVFKKFRIKIRMTHILVFLFITILVGGFWFILLLITGHPETIHEFFVYQVRLFQTRDAGHGGFLLYHFVILFLGVFPASVFALHRFSWAKNLENEKFNEYNLLMLILFWTVLILFTIVKTKIIHYSSMCYFPLTFLGALVIYKLQKQDMDYPRWIKVLLFSVSFFWGIGVAGLQLIARYKDKIIAMNIIHDDFAVGNLQADVYWSGYEFLIGMVFVCAFGWILFSKKIRHTTRSLALFVTTLLFVYATVCFITPRIEGYSQRTAVEFYQNLQGEDCYVETLGFKSYAQLYYFNKQSVSNPNSRNAGWLLEGNIDKPVYFVLKNTGEKMYLEKYPQLKKLYGKNGFVFVKREIPVTSEERKR